MEPTIERARDRLLKPGEVRVLYCVAASTLRAWAAAGKIKPVQRTVGGHRRYSENDVRALLAELAESVAA